MSFLPVALSLHVIESLLWKLHTHRNVCETERDSVFLICLSGCIASSAEGGCRRFGGMHVLRGLRAAPCWHNSSPVWGSWPLTDREPSKYGMWYWKVAGFKKCLTYSSVIGIFSDCVKLSWHLFFTGLLIARYPEKWVSSVLVSSDFVFFCWKSLILSYFTWHKAELAQCSLFLPQFC